MQKSFKITTEVHLTSSIILVKLKFMNYSITMFTIYMKLWACMKGIVSDTNVCASCHTERRLY